MSRRRARVLLVGPYPPPWGGDAVQVLTLLRRLAATPGVECRVLDLGKSRAPGDRDCTVPRGRGEFVARLFAGAARSTVLHLFTNGHNERSWRLALLAGLAGRVTGCRTIVSLGSGLAPAFVRGAGAVTRTIVRAAVRLADTVLCSNEATHDALASLGAPRERLRVRPGFHEVDATGPPPPVFVEFRRRAPLLGAMASTGAEYGIPLLLDAVAKLADRHPNLGLVLLGPGRVDDPRLDGALLCTGELPHDQALSVIERLDVFVRPTTFDGDSLSVREALLLGVPVVASATDFRPRGVSLFAPGDGDDLVRALVAACGTKRGSRRSGRTADGAFTELLALYRQGARAREMAA